MWECERLCKQLVTHHIVMSLTCSCWKRCLVPPPLHGKVSHGAPRRLGPAGLSQGGQSPGFSGVSLTQLRVGGGGMPWGPPHHGVKSRWKAALTSLYGHPELLLVRFRPRHVRGQDAH